MGAWFVDILLTQWKTQFQDNPCVNMNHFGTISVVFSFLSILFSCYVAALQAGKDVKENLKNWAKQQEAELAEEQDSVDRIRKALEEARR